MKQENRSKR